MPTYSLLNRQMSLDALPNFPVTMAAERQKVTDLEGFFLLVSSSCYLM